MIGTVEGGTTTVGRRLLIQVQRMDLPSPDIVVLNHARRGVVLIADNRVPEERIQAAREVVERRAELHTERLTSAAYLPELSHRTPGLTLQLPVPRPTCEDFIPALVG